MSRRADLPPALNVRAFRVRDALTQGATRERLGASDLDSSVHGARSRMDGGNLDAVAAIMAADQAFAGPTAAKLWGMPLPRSVDADERLWVSTRSRDRSMRRPEVVGVRRSHGDVVHADGYPVLDPAFTWTSLWSILEEHDLVAVADHLITTTPRRPALASSAELVAAMQATRRGNLKLRLAAAEMRMGSWSRPESLLRLAVMRAGLPEPVLNVETRLAGNRRAQPDLAWPDWRVCAEYDGFWHDTPRRRASDLERHEALVDAGWLVTHIRSRDLFPEPLVAVARILRRLTSRGYRHPHAIERALTGSWLP